VFVIQNVHMNLVPGTENCIHPPYIGGPASIGDHACIWDPTSMSENTVLWYCVFASLPHTGSFTFLA